jgi:ArsR family transcriptional regulator
MAVTDRPLSRVWAPHPKQVAGGPAVQIRDSHLVFRQLLAADAHGSWSDMLKRSPGASSPRLNDDQIYELAEMFRLMSDPSRLSIVLSCLAEKVSVGEMAQRLRLSPSLVSHHLRLLRAARLLQADRQGRQVFYQITDEHVARMLSDMVAHVAEEHDLEAP